jgi:hypothetical protein
VNSFFHAINVHNLTRAMWLLWSLRLFTRSELQVLEVKIHSYECDVGDHQILAEASRWPWEKRLVNTSSNQRSTIGNWSASLLYSTAVLAVRTASTVKYAGWLFSHGGLYYRDEQTGGTLFTTLWQYFLGNYIQPVLIGVKNLVNEIRKQGSSQLSIRVFSTLNPRFSSLLQD